MRVRVLSGNETGQVVDLPRAEAEVAVATGFAALIPAEPEPPLEDPSEDYVDVPAAAVVADPVAEAPLGPVASEAETSDPAADQESPPAVPAEDKGAEG